MQMLGTWLVAFQAIRLDGGRCFKGVHLSQVHQQNYQVPNKTVKCTNFLSVVNIPAWMVHLRQVHPLKKAFRKRNKKAAGHAVMSSGYTLIYKLLQYCLAGALETSAPPENTPEVTSRSSCHQPRRCPCRASTRRCRGSVRRCCKRGCQRSCWQR